MAQGPASTIRSGRPSPSAAWNWKLRAERKVAVSPPSIANCTRTAPVVGSARATTELVVPKSMPIVSGCGVVMTRLLEGRASYSVRAQ